MKREFDTTDAQSAGKVKPDAEVLAIAHEVLEEYQGVPGTTRIERLASWVVEQHWRAATSKV